MQLTSILCKLYQNNYEGKKFQNIAKEGLEFSDEGEKDKKNLESMQESFKPLTKWLEETALKGMVREGLK